MSPLAARLPRRGGEISLSPIKEMEILAARVPGVVSLAQGIPSFDTPEPIRRYVIEKIEAGATSRYSLTAGLPRLRELIAEALARDGMRYEPETEILVSCGAIEALSATLLALLRPGDEVILPSPCYASYPEAIRIAGGVPRFVPLVEEENFAFDPEAIRRALNRRTTAILFANPNNPTGTLLDRNQIAGIVDLADRHGLRVICDEVYKDFLYGDQVLFSPARIGEARDRIIRIFSFSKAYGMTGWRVGFLHSAAENVAEILKVHDALVTCAPVVSQYAAMAALELGDRLTGEFRDEFRRRRNRTLAALDSLSDIFDYQKPDASYFVFPRVKDTVPLARDSRALALDILDRARVAVVPGVAFGPSGEAHLRLSYSRDTAEIDLAFERLHEYFRAGRAAAPARPETRGVPRGRPFSLRLATAWLSLLARLRLAANRPRIVGIAGLRGKTVMKRWFRDILEPAVRVRTNPRSYNTEIGLPFAILDTEIRGNRPARAVVEATLRAFATRERADVLVLEMGLRRTGDAQTLLRTVVPDILVVTPIAPSFSDDLPFLETVAAETREIAAAVDARGGTILVCEDDARALFAVEGLAGVRRYGLSQYHEEAEGRGRIEAGGQTWEVGLDAVGDNSRYALVAALGVAEVLGIPPETIAPHLRGM